MNNSCIQHRQHYLNMMCAYHVIQTCGSRDSNKQITWYILEGHVVLKCRSRDMHMQRTTNEVNVNVNWYFLMKPSWKSHAIELSLFIWRNARWRHWKCSYKHSSRLQLEAQTQNSIFNNICRNQNVISENKTCYKSYNKSRNNGVYVQHYRRQ